jgi:mono/diheme cytochrome c family protein
MRIALRAMQMLGFVVLAAAGMAAGAQDAARGKTLFVNTRGAVGKPVGNCVACHANTQALREMIRNRGGKPDDPRSVRAVLERAIAGAQPGAVNAKAQYRGVLGGRDLADLAAYIAGAKSAQADGVRVAQR